MQRMIFSLLFSVIVMALAAPRAIPLLQKLGLKQTIYELGPESHQKKQGTPTMGGLLIASVTIVFALVFHGGRWHGISDFSIALIILSLATMGVGFADDYIKASKERSLGLTAKQKLIAQVIIGILFSLYCYLQPQVGSKIIIPFTDYQWDLGIFYVPLMTLLVIFMTNSANLQDGVDGLLSSVSSIGSSAWGLCAIIMMVSGMGLSQHSMSADNLQQVCIFAMAMTGATLGFLRVNYHPAKVFMGDTGSMFIGGATVGMAMLLRQPFLLLLIAFPMIMSSLSVIIQRLYFKATKGKRIFKMSPIHHHFELSGYSEKQIVALYSVVTGVLSIIAIVSLIKI